MTGRSKHRLGQQVGILSAPRRPPGPLAVGTVDPAAPQVAQLMRQQRQLETRLRVMRLDLAEALDGWEDGAGEEEQRRIDELRRRHGLSVIAPMPEPEGGGA